MIIVTLNSVNTYIVLHHIKIINSIANYFLISDWCILFKKCSIFMFKIGLTVVQKLSALQPQHINRFTDFLFNEVTHFEIIYSYLMIFFRFSVAKEHFYTVTVNVLFIKLTI